jgi:hypothetical protein
MFWMLARRQLEYSTFMYTGTSVNIGDGCDYNDDDDDLLIESLVWQKKRKYQVN